MPKHICFFGIYDPEYSRNKILLEGLRCSGVRVTECRVNPCLYGRFRKYFALVRSYLALPRRDFDALFVAFPGPTVMPVARLLFRGPIIYDAFISFYDSNVFDRKKYPQGSLGALWDRFLDHASTLLADLCLFDTEQHVRYFQELYQVDPKKCIRVFIGSDTTRFQKITAPVRTDGRVLVQFHGSFVPLQGIPYILEAVSYLKEVTNIHLRVVGGSVEHVAAYEREINARGLSRGVTFTGRVDPERVPEYVGEADIVLGVFGDTPKTQRVIPNKVFEAVAMGKAVITADTPAIREAFTDRENIILCRHADSADLARVIIELSCDAALRMRVGEAAYVLARETLSPEHVVAPILPVLNKLS